jgi:hypothetical protein
LEAPRLDFKMNEDSKSHKTIASLIGARESIKKIVKNTNMQE